MIQPRRLTQHRPAQRLAVAAAIGAPRGRHRGAWGGRPQHAQPFREFVVWLV